jgi:hypothetical protein
MVYLVGEDLLDAEFDATYEAEIKAKFPKGIQHLVEWVIGMMRSYRDTAEAKLVSRTTQLLQLSFENKFDEVKAHMKSEFIKGGLSNMNGVTVPNLKWPKGLCFLEEEDEETIDTKDWNPATFAIYNNNLEMLEYFLDETPCLVKKCLKLPSSSLSQDICTLFPILWAFEHQNQKLFSFLFDQLYYLWNDDMLILKLLKTIMKSLRPEEEKITYLKQIFRSPLVIGILHSMSF